MNKKIKLTEDERNIIYWALLKHYRYLEDLKGINKLAELESLIEKFIPKV